MKFLELIKQRYSCRKYLPIPVEKEKVIECIEAARLSPSACNAQPWKFVVIDDIKIKEEVIKVATSGVYKMSKFISQAPVVIIVIADEGSFLSKAGSFVRNTKFYLLDVGIAVSHICLQATELGLGSCIVGWFNENKVKKVLKIPKKYKIPLLISLGYPDLSQKNNDFIRKHAKSDLRKEIKEILTFNRF